MHPFSHDHKAAAAAAAAPDDDHGDGMPQRLNGIAFCI